jgi:hypothetical protein
MRNKVKEGDVFVLKDDLALLYLYKYAKVQMCVESSEDYSNYRVRVSDRLDMLSGSYILRNWTTEHFTNYIKLIDINGIWQEVLNE